MKFISLEHWRGIVLDLILCCETFPSYLKHLACGATYASPLPLFTEVNLIKVAPESRFEAQENSDGNPIGGKLCSG